MSGIEKPCLATSVASAPRTEWPLKTLVSMPVRCISSFNHLANVAGETGLCGWMRDNRRLLRFKISCSLYWRVLASYSCRHLHRLKHSCPAKLAWKQDFGSWPCLASLISCGSLNWAPSGWKYLKRKSRAARPELCLGQYELATQKAYNTNVLRKVVRSDLTMK